MSKVVLGMNVTLDGYVARTNGELDWMFPNIDAERTKSIVDGLQRDRRVPDGTRHLRRNGRTLANGG